MPGTAISIRPKDERVFHRYAPSEMSGPLPETLYKVLPAKYAKRMVRHGELMWSTLTWFQNEESVGRGDQHEGARNYFPVGGLEVHRSERDGKPDDATFTVPNYGLKSTAARGHRIFIYSLTLDPTFLIGAPSEAARVEISDPARFAERIRAALVRHHRVYAETFIHDVVKYWSVENPPEAVYALPHMLVMHKAKDFESQQEYRFAFGTSEDVFDFENVKMWIVDSEFRQQRQTLDPKAHRLKLRLGSLTDCCRVS